MSHVEHLAEGEPSDAMLDAAAHSLAIFWPTRSPGMCAVGLLRRDEGPAVLAAAREVLIAAERWREADRQSAEENLGS